MDRLTPQHRSWLMGRVKCAHTLPEKSVRRISHKLGYRFRLHKKDLPGKPDLVFPRLRKIILVHGCFWHGHKNCRYACLPKTRKRYWSEKFNANRLRDAKNIRTLKRMGWQVMIVWQCQLRHLERTEARLKKFLEGG